MDHVVGVKEEAGRREMAREIFSLCQTAATLGHPADHVACIDDVVALLDAVDLEARKDCARVASERKPFGFITETLPFYRWLELFTEKSMKEAGRRYKVNGVWFSDPEMAVIYLQWLLERRPKP